MTTRGFSLLELMVVVAVIGILSGAGLIGYQAYIDGVRGDQIVAVDEKVNETIEADRFILESELVLPDYVDSVAEATCGAYVFAKIADLNARDGVNPFDESDALRYFNGNGPATALEWVSGGVTRAANNQVTFPRGKTLVFCADQSQPLHQTRLIMCSCGTPNAGTLCQTTNSWATVNAMMTDPAEDPLPANECPHPNS